MDKIFYGPEELRELAERHMTVCEGVYAVAIARNDVETAAHAARSALFVALKCAIDLDQDLRKATAVSWLERLCVLYSDAVPASAYLSKAIRWATDETARVFPPDDRNPDTGTSESRV